MPEADGILGEIVARKRLDVAARLNGTTLESLRGRTRPTRRSLRAVLARPGARFIMEVKRVSPSAGALRPGADPVAMARAYSGAADAISVLTDAPYFGGSFADLQGVRAEYDGPLLAKDFMIDLRQVAEARMNGADAILVMLSVLDDEEAAAMIVEAKRLNMDVLVEAHSEDEVRRAVALGAAIIGINNRDLRTLQVDLATTERLAALVPPDRLLVAESGIESRADVDRLAPLADAFLVGSALMKAEDPALAARALAFGRIKVCGLTDASQVGMASASGASFAGLIMVPGTPRAVSAALAREMVEANQSVKFVGVFRNEKVMQVSMSAKLLGLSAVQIHGEEDAAYIKALRAMLPAGCEIWAAGVVGRDMPQPRLGADRTLFDTMVDGQSGGTGRTFDWSRLDGRADLPEGVLAGGLNPENARAAAKVGAYALDVGSGVEAAPGRKDPAKLQAFFEAVRTPVRGDPAC